MKNQYIGIDYSNGMSNVDTSNGIHYGVISQNEVLQSWADSSEPDYGKPIDGESWECTNCGAILPIVDTTEWLDTIECSECQTENEITPSDIAEPITFTLNDDEYLCSQSSDNTDIFILRSPFYTLCQYCSPCAPGAGYVMNTVVDGVKTYCFGHDWFESGKAPYPVFSVKTNKEIIA